MNVKSSTKRPRTPRTLITIMARRSAFDSKPSSLAFVELLYQLAAIKDPGEREDYVWHVSELVYAHTPQYVSGFQAFDDRANEAARSN